MRSLRTHAMATMASLLIVLPSAAHADPGKAKPAGSSDERKKRSLPPEPAVTYPRGAGTERVEHGEVILDVDEAQQEAPRATSSPRQSSRRGGCRAPRSRRR